MLTKRLDIKRAIKNHNLSIAKAAEMAGYKGSQAIFQFCKTNVGVEKLYPIAEKAWGGDITDLFFPCEVTIEKDENGIEHEKVVWIKDDLPLAPTSETPAPAEEQQEDTAIEPEIHICPRCGMRWQELPPLEEENEE